MAKRSITAGSTSVMLQVFAQDSAKTDGSGKTGVLYNATGLTCYYKRNTASASASVSLADIGTLGTFASGGWKEVDATNMPGVYEFHPPDTAFAAGADSVAFWIGGASGMAALTLEIELRQAPAQVSFLMVQSSDHRTAATGLTVTAQKSANGGAFGAATNSPAEIGSTGVYTLALTAAERAVNSLTLLFTATGADNRYIILIP